MMKKAILLVLLSERSVTSFPHMYSVSTEVYMPLYKLFTLTLVFLDLVHGPLEEIPLLQADSQLFS